MIFNRQVIILLFFTLASAGVKAQDADTIPPPISEGSQLHAVVLHYDATRARSKGENAEAEQLLRKALGFDPQAAGIYYDLARINMSGNKTAEAEKNIRKAIELSPENSWYKIQYAEILQGQGRFKDAAAQYEKVLLDDEHNKEYLQTLVHLYQRAGEKEKALAAIDELLKMYGDDEEMLDLKLQLYLANNETDKAVELAKKLITMFPGESRYHISLAEIYNNTGKSDLAADVFKKAELLFPGDAGIQLSLAAYYKSKGDNEQYKLYLRKVIANNVLKPSDKLTILGQTIATAKDSADRMFVLELAEDIAAQSPEDAIAHAAYGDMLGLTGSMVPAAEQYKKSLQIDPANYVVWKNLLSVYMQEQQADSIVKYSDKALRLFPNQAQLHLLNGMGHNYKKDYPKAINAVNRAIDMLPEENKEELAEMYGVLADIYNSAGQFELSDKEFDKALQLTPDNASTLNNYAYYLSERGVRLDDAEKMSKRSLELVPDLPTFLDTYGWIMYKKGNYKKARDYIEKAIEKEAEKASGILWDHLGDAYYKLNDKDKAATSWQKAKQLGADNPQLDKKISELKLYE